MSCSSIRRLTPFCAARGTTGTSRHYHARRRQHRGIANRPATCRGPIYRAPGTPTNDVPVNNTPIIRHVAFHEYTSCEPAATIDCAIMNMLYQPGNAWIHYGLALAAYALRPGGSLYVVGTKDRGIVTIARHMQERFGNVETLEIHKGQRVVRSQQPATPLLNAIPSADDLLHAVFAQGKLDEGTRLLVNRWTCIQTMMPSTSAVARATSASTLPTSPTKAA